MATREPKPRSVRRGPGLGALLIGLLAFTSLACNHQLPRLNARGQHAEVVERAAHARWLPRRKAARAWADSLVTLGRVDEARAVLLRDFRTSAELASLVALADLELREGLRGLAAAHYARAASLEVDVLRGRDDVCALLRDRATRYFAAGEALAADLDMRRIAVICPRPQGSDAAAIQASDRALHLQIVAAAKRQAQAQRTLVGCKDNACKAPASDAEQRAIAADLGVARSAGPGPLRAAARRLRVQLSAGDVAALLGAELQGELGLDIVTHDELRAWIGETSPVSIHDAVGTLSPALQTYARLRLAQLGPDYELPGGDATRSTASNVVKLLELFDADPEAAAMSWRVFVLVGDLPSAELALTAGLGTGSGVSTPAGTPPLLTDPASAAPVPKDSSKPPVPKARSAKPTPPVSPAPPEPPRGPGFQPSQTRVPVPLLWSARRRVDAGSLPKLLLLARLRALGGHDDQALEIARFALAEARAQNLPDAEDLAHAEARRYLANGQPWAALGVADAVPGATTSELGRAVGAAILLGRAACGPACDGAESPRDRVAVRQVLGEPWLLAEEARARDLALARDRSPADPSGCPELAELLAPDARGPLPEALAQVRAELTGARSMGLAPGTGPKGQPTPLTHAAPASPAKGAPTPPPSRAGEALRRAVESDPTLACAGRIAGPLFYAGDHRVAATALADELIHVPQEVAAGLLLLQSELALGLGRRDQADMMLIAAAGAASDPVAVWQRAARLAARVDARHYQVLALRQALMHVPARDAAPLRLALVVRALRDANDAWAARESEVGREALLRSVDSYLEAEPPARRWQARDDLAVALAAYTWADPQAALLIHAALWPEPALQRQHPAAAARLERALGGVAEATASTPLAPAELAAALAGPNGPAPEIPAAALAFVPVDQLHPLRLELARHHPDPQQRLRSAIAVATTGAPATRLEALRLLLAEMARDPARDPARRDAVVDLLLAGLSSADLGERARTQPMVPSEDELLALVFGLTREPARAPREIKGE